MSVIYSNREVVIYFKFHENRSRRLGAVGGGVENHPLPLTRPMAYTTACTTVQAVIHVLVAIQQMQRIDTLD